MIKLSELHLNDLNNTKITPKSETEHMDIAVIGVCLQTAQADNIHEFWDNIQQGKDCITELPVYRKKDSDSYLQLKGIKKNTAKYHIGGFINRVDEFDYLFFNISPKEASLMNPHQKLFLQCVWKAIEDAGYGGNRLKGSNTGVYIGHSAGVFVDAMYDYSNFIPLIEPESSAMAVAGNLPSIIASRISYLLDFKGPSIALDTACSSSLVAIHYACQDLKSKNCDVAIAGGVKINLFPLERDYKMGVESSDGRAKSFDDSSDGTGRGEGVAAVILKPLKSALRDQDHIYAIIKGSAVNQDGSSIGITAPNALAQEKVIVKAWEDAMIDPRTISYIEAHGTGTELGDPIEIDGIKRAFSRYTNQKQFCAVGTLKTNIGHLDNAAGIFGLIKCILSMKNQMIPPIANFRYPNRDIDFADSPTYVNIKLSEWKHGGFPRRCGVSSFGLSGTNCHIVLEEAPRQIAINQKMLKRHILTISAKNKKALERMIKNYHTYVNSNENSTLESICYTANTGRAVHKHRLAMIVSHRSELCNQLSIVIKEGLDSNQRDKGIYYLAYTEDQSYGDKTTGSNVNKYAEYMDTLNGAHELCLQYLTMKDFNWLKVYGELSYTKSSIPTYEFDKTRCWLEIPENFAFDIKDMNNQVKNRQAVILNGELDEGSIEIDKHVADIWGNTLGLKEVSTDDSFFSLGGDSIVAIKLTDEINERFMIEAEVVDLLKRPVFRDYLRHLKETYLVARRMDVIEKISRVQEAEFYPVSNAEKMIFIQEQFGTLGNAYNIPVALFIHGKLDIDKVKSSFEKVVALNEALRTSFEYQNGEVVQKVAKTFELEFKTYDAIDDEHLLSYIRPFELSKAPLMRINLFKKSSEDTIILLDIHHIIADGVSMGIIVKEFAQIYKGESVNGEKLQYKDYTMWQRNLLQNSKWKEHEIFWQKKISGELPALMMPLDFKRGSERTFSGNTIEFTIQNDITEKLLKLANEQSITLNNVLFSIYALLLLKYTAQDEVIIGIVTSGRINYQLFDTIGMFNNFVPVRIAGLNTIDIMNFVRLVNDELIEAYAHQDYPYESILEVMDIQTEKSRNPIFDTVYIFHNEFTAAQDLLDKDMSVEYKPIITNTSKLDLKIDIFTRQDNSLTCMLEYSVALFKQETIDRLCHDFVDIAKLVGDNPQKQISNIRLFDQDEISINARRSLNSLGDVTRIMVTSTFTSDLIEDYMVWWLKQFSIHNEIGFTAYNQVFQELLDDKSSISKNKGINVLLIRFEDWIRDNTNSDQILCIELKRNFEELLSILKDKEKRASYLVGIFPVSTHLKLNYEIVECINKLNERWKSELAHMNKVYVMDFTNIGYDYSIEKTFDPIRDDLGHIPFTDEFYASMSAEIARKICAIHNNSVFKVIALDADNTLWGGVCGEIGAQGIDLSSHYLGLQQFMVNMYNKGMLLVICSKNNEQDVWDVIEKNPNMILKREHIVTHRINWQNKSENLKDMASELNVGIDSFIFIDDSSMECTEVITNCSEVLTLKLPENPEKYPLFLKHAWCFDKINVTNEDTKRTQMYISEKKRKKAQNDVKSIDDFLKELDLNMKINDITSDEFSRASQLTQRTNQFNMSTIRRSEEELQELVKGEGIRCLTVYVSDRFGEYGMVGLVIFEQREKEVLIDSFILSCRVLGRGIEDAIISYIADECKRMHIPTVKARFIKTSKNKPVEEFLSKYQWRKIKQIHDEKWLEIEVNSMEAKYKYITVHKEALKTKQTYEKKKETIFGIIDHIAIAVESIERSKLYYESMGYLCSKVVEDKLQNARLMMCYKSNHTSIELVAPVNEHSPSFRILIESGEQPYHLCYCVKSIKLFLCHLQDLDISYEIISENKPALLFDNKEVCFISVRGCCLIELLEDENLNSVNQTLFTHRNEEINILTNDAGAAAFFNALGYYVVKNARDLSNNAEVVLYNNTAESIRLLIPQSKTGNYYERLKEKGAHILDFGSRAISVNNIMDSLQDQKYIEEDQKYNDIEKVFRICDKDYIYFYTVIEKNDDININDWEMEIPGYDLINHAEYILPLSNNKGSELLKLPIYEISKHNIIKVDYVAPRNEAERRIAEVWEEVLNVDKIGVNDNFFELGGNSIKGVQIISKLTMDFEVHLNDIFKYNTIALLSQNAPFKENHFRHNLKIMKDAAIKNQERNYTDDPECITKYERYLDAIKIYDSYDYQKNNSFENICFFGATGYLGAHMLEKLLKNTKSNLYTIIRGESAEVVRERLRDTLIFYFEDDIYMQYRERIFIIPGDFSKKHFGLEKKIYEDLGDKIDCIINAAANVKHYGKFEPFYESNVVGVQHIIEFSQTGRKKEIHHISTLNVAHGKVNDIDNYVFTEYDHDIGQEEENVYIYTKLEGEKLLVSARDKQIDVNIYRVGNLVYNTETNKFQKNIENNAFYTLVKSFICTGNAPALNREVLDFSFVDITAQAIMILINKKALKNETYHIFNPNRISFTKLGEYLKGCGYDVDTPNMDAFIDYLYDNFDNPAVKEHILDILVHGYIMGDINDTNFYIMADKTNKILANLGFEWRGITSEGVRNLVEYCKKVNFL